VNIDAEVLRLADDFDSTILPFRREIEAALELRRQHAHIQEMLKALQRLTHPAADDEDLAYALEVIAKATGGAA
jgi:hypothetical protein